MSDSLNALDATFLELEEADQGAHMHIGAVMVFEPPKGGGGPAFEDLCDQLEERLGSLPHFHQRLSEPRTGGIHWPSWEEVSLDVRHHLRREHLPAPGGEPELLAWAGEFYSARLDRARPLWEMVVLEGLADGRWAIATKTHHCMVDGVGSVDIGNLMLDAEPDAGGSPDPADPAPGDAPERAPDQSSRAGGWGGPAAGALKAARSLATAPLRAAGSVAKRGGSAVSDPVGTTTGALRRSRALIEVLIRDELMAAPQSSINTPIGAKRRVAISQVPLAELKEVNGRLGGTVNDVVLAMATGALRRLLVARGETPPAKGLRAMVPVNVREASERLQMGNRITSLFVHLPVALAEPLERYRSQMTEAEGLKSGDQGLGTSMIVDLAGHAPPVLHSFVARSLFATRLFNLTITNVPGARAPLYALGSRMIDVWPIVPLAADHAVGLAVLSYDGKLFFCLNADSEAMPDLEILSEGLEESLAELQANVGDEVS